MDDSCDIEDNIDSTKRNWSIYNSAAPYTECPETTPMNIDEYNIFKVMSAHSASQNNSTSQNSYVHINDSKNITI
jgi:hypothetical protein